MQSAQEASQNWFTRLHDQVQETLSLKRFDQTWRETTKQSLLLGPLLALRMQVGDGGLGSRLQQLSFLVMLVLFAILPAPQFANDKNLLALVALTGLGLWLLGYILGGREKRRANSVDILVLLFFAINIIAAFASHYFAESLHGLYKVAVYIASYFYFSAVLGQSRRRQVTVVSVALLAGLLVSLYGLYQYKIGVQPLATWEDPTVETKGTRIFSTLGNPNLLAGYLLPLVPLATSLGIGLVWMKKWLWSIPPFVVGGIIAVATILTGSRGGYIGVFAALGVLVLIVVERVLSERPKARLPVAIVLLVGTFAILLGLHFVPTFEQRVTSIFAGREHSSNSFRMNVYNSSFRMFKDNWWIGVGPGNQAFRLAYGLYMTSGFDALGTYCVPLEVAVEAGIVALALFAVLIVSLLGRSHVAFWSERQGFSIWLVAGVAAALIGMMMHGLVDTVFYRPQVHFIFWLLVAIAQSEPGKIDETSNL